MKVSTVVLLSLALGLCLGAATGYWQYGAAATVQAAGSVDPGDPASVAVPGKDGNQPRVAVGETTFQFGDMEQGSTKSHEFTFTNEGTALLTLEVGETTCKCTLGKLKQDTLAPGKSTAVTLEWKAEVPPGAFRQSAVIRTNDPDRPTVTLVVVGVISTSVQTVPSDLVLSSVSASEPTHADIKLFCYHSGDFQITDLKFEQLETADYFDISYQPLAMPDAEDGQAKSGYKLQLRIKPGLPLGPFQQTILVGTNLESRPEIKIPVHGTVTGDISVLGPRWDSRQNVLRLGPVKRREGNTRELKIFVRGTDHEKIQFEVASKDPDFLEISLGQASQINNGLVTQVPLRISVPKGTLAVNRMGSDQGPFGEIVLKTNHAKDKQLVLRVQFAVEE